MNSNQSANLLGTVIQLVMGYLVSRGIISHSENETVGASLIALVTFIATHNWHGSANANPPGTAGKSPIVGLFMLSLIAAFALTGCAHMVDKSTAYHEIKTRAIIAPAGWMVVKPTVTNTATGNLFADDVVIMPSGTNSPGFWAMLLSPTPKVVTTYHERWQDKSGGGGTFLLTDPQASQVSFSRTNQTALGGSHGAAIGNIQSTISTNAVGMANSVGGAIGNVVSTIVKKTVGQ